jgi:hypothetical protein
MAAMSEFITLDSGLVVNCGLAMPNAAEVALMAHSPEYPADRMLSDKDIQRGLPDGTYQRSRQRFAPWMINQNPLGKCNASALKGAFEQVRANQGFPHVILSDNDAYMQMNGGQDNGSALIRAFEVGQKRGVAPLRIQVEGKEYRIPLDAYRRGDLSPAAKAAAETEAARFRGWEWYRAPRKFDEFCRCLASELARRNPVVFAWHVGSSSSRLDNGYVRTGNGKGNHATYFHSAKWVGGKTLVHPDMRNSWGPSQHPDYGNRNGSWGDGGYALFTMEQAFACNEYHDTYIVTSARPDYQDQFVRM